MALFANGQWTQTHTINNGGGGTQVVFSADVDPDPSPATTLMDVTIINHGPNTVYLGNGTATTAGFPLGAGQQLTVQGYTATSGTTTNDIHGICASGQTATVQAGLASVVSVV